MVVRVGNAGGTAEVRPTPGRTGFQTAYAVALATRGDFGFFCGTPWDCDAPYRGPVCMLWYDTGGRLHLDKVGQNRVLRKLVA
jgi:hypothetical protein